MQSDVVALFRCLRQRPVRTHYGALHEAILGVAEKLRRNADGETSRALAHALLEWAEHVSVEEASRARQSAARVVLQVPGNLQAAAHLLGHALEQSPEDCMLRELSTQQLLARGAYVELASVLERHATACQGAPQVDDATRAQAWTRLGHLRARRLDDRDGAVEAYERALRAQPELATLQILTSLYESRAEPDDAQRAAELYMRMAEQERPAQACEHLLRSLELRPGHAGALALLASLESRVHEEVTPQALARKRDAVRGATLSSQSCASERRNLLHLPMSAIPLRSPGSSASVPSVAMSAQSLSPRGRARTRPPSRHLRERWVVKLVGLTVAAGLAALLVQLSSGPSSPQSSGRAAAAQGAMTGRPAERQGRVSEASPSPSRGALALAPALSPAVGAQTVDDEGAVWVDTDEGTVSSGSEPAQAEPRARVWVAPKQTYVDDGRVPPGEFWAAVEQLRTVAQTCYQKALDRRPGLRGRVGFTWTILSSGRAAHIGRHGDTLGDPALRECVRNALATSTLPAPREGRARARAVLVFLPGTESAR